uniref:WD_REPEATS_REGION domain-containing protein n=1 Tax=Caenorhabditis tropicalis TaxID=1561998 RepID=A0A1I7T831_9PELO
METQTTETNRKDAECTANFQSNKEVQTDLIDNEIGKEVKKDIRISKEVLGHIYEFIRDDSKVNYDRLLEFHRFDKIVLEKVQKYHIESSSIPLPVCAISAVFFSSTQFILGDISGNISMCTKDGITFQKKITDGAVTCLELCRHGLISGSDDGNVVLWQIGSSGLEKIGGVRLTVSDLSRKIRRSSTSNKPVAIVSMQASGEEVCVATETGGLYLLSLPSFDSKPLTQNATSINKILFESPYIAVVYTTSNSAVFTAEGLVDEIPFIAKLAVK